MSHSEHDTGRTRVFYDGMQAGIEKERERIIKLLEQSLYYSETDLCLFWANGEQTQATLNGLIALIKGEQK